MRKIISVIGRPGTGKSTLFREFMKNYTWERVEPAKLIVAEYCKELDLYIMGPYDPDVVFCGPDKLSMAVGPEFEKWVQTHNSNIMFEGDRLSGQKMFDFLINLKGTDFRIVSLSIPETMFVDRYAARGSNQNEQFLRAKETKIGNILNNFEYRSVLDEFENKDSADQTRIIRFLEETLNGV